MTVEKQHHITFGTHEASFVEPDQLFFVFRGVFDGENADPYLNFVFTQGDRVGRPLYAAYDLSAFSHATSAGRARVIKTSRAYPYAALAVFGTRFATQIVANMIITAGKLVSPKHFEFPVKFFSTVTEANAWFDELRVQRAKTRGKD